MSCYENSVARVSQRFAELLMRNHLLKCRKFGICFLLPSFSCLLFPYESFQSSLLEMQFFSSHMYEESLCILFPFFLAVKAFSSRVVALPIVGGFQLWRKGYLLSLQALWAYALELLQLLPISQFPNFAKNSQWAWGARATRPPIGKSFATAQRKPVSTCRRFLSQPFLMLAPKAPLDTFQFGAPIWSLIKVECWKRHFLGN